MPKIHLPPPEEVEAWLGTLAGEPLSYAHAGGVDRPPECGFILDIHRVKLGTGEVVYEAARRALRSWVMFPSWTQIYPSGQVQEEGRIVAMVTRIMGFWWINPCRILQRIEEATPDLRRCGFTYGTLAQHAECGEERFMVEMLPDETVWYEIRAFSRPRHWTARVAFPLARWWQLRFVRDSQAAMQSAVNAHVNPSA